MSSRQFQRQHKIEQDKLLSATVRKHLSADALIRSLRSSFEQVGETRKRKPVISMEDALMSAYAMFSLKSPGLLDFEPSGRSARGNSQGDSERGADRCQRFPELYVVPARTAATSPHRPNCLRSGFQPYESPASTAFADNQFLPSALGKPHREMQIRRTPRLSTADTLAAPS